MTELLDPATGEVVGSPEGNGFVDGVRGEGYVLRREDLFGSDADPFVRVNVAVRDSEDADLGWGGTIAIRSAPTPSCGR